MRTMLTESIVAAIKRVAIKMGVAGTFGTYHTASWVFTASSKQYALMLKCA
jgi:hypothetical protein